MMDRRVSDPSSATGPRPQLLLNVLETRLDGRSWVMGDEYSIADISLLGWGRHLVGFYGAGELVGYANLKSVPSWLERVLARPAVERGLSIPARPRMIPMKP